MASPYSTPVPDIDPTGTAEPYQAPSTLDRVGDWMYNFNDPKANPPPEALIPKRFGNTFRYPYVQGREMTPGDWHHNESLWDIIRDLFHKKD